MFFLWQVVAIAILRLFGISLPFSFAVHFYARRERELAVALDGRSLETYVLVAGFLLLACPIWVGLITFDYLSAHYIYHLPYQLRQFVGSVVGLAVCGVWVGLSSWKASAKTHREPAV
jgi:hypothetical protein